MPPFVLNIPNVLTLVRFVMVPLSCLPLLPIFGEHNLFTLILVTVSFILAAITDYYDGYFARKLDQHSEWGAYMDPLIDKFLVWGLYFVFLFIPTMHIPIWTFVVIFTRDILVTEMRNFAIHHNMTFKTSFLAKLKTTSQMIVGGGILVFLLITYLLNDQSYPNYMDYWLEVNLNLYNLPRNLIIGIALFTGITGIDYGITLYKTYQNASKD